MTFMNEIIQKMSACGLVPVVSLENASQAPALAAAIRAGGLNCAEITFRTCAAEEAIRRISSEYPDFLLIAGTVLRVEQADAAIRAGAAAVVSPGLNLRVVAHCIEKGCPTIPGVCTPSEVETAMTFGLQYLKFFPAEAYGGVRTIKALAAPYPAVKFMPTGGVNGDNFLEYLSCENVFACGGSWMVPAATIAKGAYQEIERMVRAAVNQMGAVHG